MNATIKISVDENIINEFILHVHELAKRATNPVPFYGEEKLQKIADLINRVSESENHNIFFLKISRNKPEYIIELTSDIYSKLKMYGSEEYLMEINEICEIMAMLAIAAG